ncbi:EamA family transporter RarD [Sphingosinicella sp. LHD-64]|uniref:EamA family transporter RarD n=1 Tax=Sphingosinicella sp. LHD-64 TaxID=3072139 RepID=UPI00280FC246|nr:EamA family transporter RarD [Sphingosinicella sp. LHD-64]MDQ8758266.1 EamA family transporter RarD [Sphingosinicella sp. LHD-64]
MSEEQSRTRAGLLFGVGAYLCWGLLPLYFKLVAMVPSTEIVAHRIVWSLLFLGVLATIWRRWPAIRAALGTSRVMITLTLTALLIGGNWLIYIYSIVSGHVIESSLGYYLNPLINVLLGVVLLREKLSRLQVVATVLAAAGVTVLALGAGTGLWISFALAGTFALYGFLRKIAPVDALEGLSIETLILTPIALGWLVWLQQHGQSGLTDHGTGIALLLVFGGVITAVPLLLFTAAARRLPYSTMGFLQYISPTLQFLTAVLAFGEHLTTAHLVCFALIWSALALVSFDGLRAAARARAAA